jgi:glyoxylase-like metal-dependent hydrolase (beta-lactamase superfamily II)
MEGLKMMRPDITAFFDHASFTVAYIVSDPKERRCAIIDSVLDYDPRSERTSALGADQLIDFVLDNRLGVDWILETHAHADHLTAALCWPLRLLAIGWSRRL